MCGLWLIQGMAQADCRRGGGGGLEVTGIATEHEGHWSSTRPALLLTSARPSKLIRKARRCPKLIKGEEHRGKWRIEGNAHIEGPLLVMTWMHHSA